MKPQFYTAVAFAVPLALTAAAQPASPSAGEIRTIAEKGYTFAYPLVLMEHTRRSSLERSGLGGGGEMNRLIHLREFPDAKFRTVVRPNADTLYTSAWMDLTKEPVLLRVPDTGGRYYLMQFMDAWTETFSVPGKRTTGTGEGWFALAGPGWKGTLPAKAKRIDSPTNIVWLIGRTQTNGASDYATVHAIQNGYAMMPLSLYPDGPPPPRPADRARPQPAAGARTPPMQVAQLSAADFFRSFVQLLDKNPPHTGDESLMAELARIGIVRGQAFEPEKIGAEGLKALDEGARAAAARLSAPRGAGGRGLEPDGWSGFGNKVGRYGTDYEARARIARTGLGANPPEDATYMSCVRDSGGQPLDGGRRYRLHFDKGRLPPVRAFWSVTVYSEDGYFVPNPIDRYAIGDRDALEFNADGSLDLYIQNESPGGGKNRNWLPAPKGQFNLSLRLYWPGEEILSGKWRPPAAVREQ